VLGHLFVSIEFLFSNKYFPIYKANITMVELAIELIVDLTKTIVCDVPARAFSVA
jgi:hypothetical protein